MSDRLGKIAATAFEAVIRPHLGAERDEVKVGPATGRDTAIVSLGHGQVMAVTTDPLSFIPGLGPEDSAWTSLHLIVNDLVTSGLEPAYASVDLNLPPEVDDATFDAYWKALHAECERLGIAIVAGHTGRYGESHGTVIGGGTIIGIGADDQYLEPRFAQPGDRLIVTKGAMIATTGLLARAFPETIRTAFGKPFRSTAQDLLGHYSVRADAQAALSVGRRGEGVSALHDATEGGVLGALYELATAAELGARVELERVPIAKETAEIAELFGIDPTVGLSEGSLLVAARPAQAEAVVDALGDDGIPAADVGELTRETAFTLIADGHERPWTPPTDDPYWRAYQKAVERGWR
ncbi:MAG: AIR synthase-related protein [Candidatus Bipolaricaulia bacterium]